MKNFRLLLFPFSLLYGLAIITRNWLYDAGLFKSEGFEIPVIVVGNLEVGGAGKSPMTEYLIRLVKDKYKLATLSRGYGRKTKGFLSAVATATAAEIGDEPAQFKHKFPDITVAVCEKRVAGINNLKAGHDLIILDDAYQHRAVKPGYSILLFDYSHLQNAHLLLPAGNFREPFSGRWRADVLIVSKCPGDLTEDEKANLAEKIAPLPYQHLFFTKIAYQQLQNLDGSSSAFLINADTTVFLLTGIANPAPLKEQVQAFTGHIIDHNYPDHHRFSQKNILKLAAEFSAHPAQKKVIITTEKDAQRLGEQDLQLALATLPVLVQPIATEFIGDGKVQFDQLITTYVREHTTNHRVH